MRYEELPVEVREFVTPPLGIVDRRLVAGRCIAEFHLDRLQMSQDIIAGDIYRLGPSPHVATTRGYWFTLATEQPPAPAGMRGQYVADNTSPSWSRWEWDDWGTA